MFYGFTFNLIDRRHGQIFLGKFSGEAGENLSPRAERRSGVASRDGRDGKEHSTCGRLCQALESYTIAWLRCAVEPCRSDHSDLEQPRADEGGLSSKHPVIVVGCLGRFY